MSDKLNDLLEAHLDGYRKGVPGEIQGFCPFPHAKGSDAEGGTRSLGINIEKGVFNCFSCQRKGNDAKLIAQLLNIPYLDAKKLLGHGPSKVAKEVPIEAVREAHAALLNNPDMLRFLFEKRGLTKDAVLEYQLGYKLNEKRLWIPVRDDWGRVVDVRRHLLDKTRGEPKSLPYAKAATRLFLFNDLHQEEEIIICEGELDALCARVQGFKACSVTGTGAGGWNNTFNRDFAGKRVAIIYDCDDAGRRGAIKVATLLHNAATEVKIVNLGLDGGDMKDITDYFVQSGGTADALRILIDDTLTFSPDTKVDPVLSTPATEIDLANSSLASLYGKPIRLKAIVAGKDLAPFVFPRKLTANCPMSRGPNICGVCGLAQYDGVRPLEISVNDDSVLKFINCEDTDQRSEISKRLGVSRCGLWSFTIEEAANMEELRLIPVIDYSAENSEYVIRRAFFLGHGIRSNATYEFDGTSGADPKSQQAVCILRDARAVQGSLDNYVLSDEILEQLQIFKVGAGDVANNNPA